MPAGQIVDALRRALVGDVHRLDAGFGIEQLAAEHSQPYFLALGFHKPHMPWNVPKKYFDLHPLEQIHLPPHTTNDLDDIPAAHLRQMAVLGPYSAWVYFS